MKRIGRKILAVFLAVSLLLAANTLGLLAVGAQATGLVEGISVQGAWNYDRHGLYLAQADASGAVSRVSTEQGAYSFGEYRFALYSGDFDKNAGFEGALYFFNKSADTPEGNGFSLRWGAYGLAFCDKDGNTVIDLTEDHQTIREAWKPDTWYQMVVFLLSDGRIALSIQVAAYDPAGDSFTITEALNGGNPYWPGAWSTLDAAMTQNSGYVHFTVNTADIAGEPVPYSAAIRNFVIAGYGTPSYTMPAPIPATGVDFVQAPGGPLRVGDKGSFYAVAIPPEATNRHLTVTAAGDAVRLSGASIACGYEAVSPGTTTIKAWAGGLELGELALKVGAVSVKPDSVRIAHEGSDYLSVGDTGVLCAVVEPAELAPYAVWSLVCGSSVTLDGNGAYTAIKAGTTIVRLTVGESFEEIALTVGGASAGLAGLSGGLETWMHSATGFGIAEPGDASAWRLSTVDGRYGVGEYHFKFFSGALEDDQEEFAFYFMNQSADSPEGNGPSIRWRKDGIYLYDAQGVKRSLTAQHEVLRTAWLPHTWYQIVVYVLDNTQLALNVQVLRYEEAADAYTLVSAVNGGGHLWDAWTSDAASAGQNTGYAHFVVRGADYRQTARVEDFHINGYGKPSYAAPAYVPLVLVCTDSSLRWNVAKNEGLLELEPGKTGRFQLYMENGESATYPSVNILDIQSDGVSLTHDGSGFHYAAGSQGSATVTLLAGGLPQADGSFVGGQLVTLKLAVRIDATNLEIIGAPKGPLDVGDSGQLTAKLLPDNATTDVVWSVEGQAVTIDDKGRYIAVAGGRAIITATAGDISESVTLTVLATGFRGMKMTRGIWCHSATGLYPVDGNEETAVISTAAGQYSMGEYSFKLFSGNLDEGYEGAMYLLSDSPDTPEGHGLSFRWSRDGLFICNAAGERVFDLTEQFATIRYVWAKNTWYNFVIFLLADNQMALRVQVLAYDEYSDSFSVATETNEGNPYWPGNWTDVDPSMPQNAGYVHFVLPAAQASEARIEDFSITGYGGPSYAVPAFRRSELAVSGHEVSWSQDRKTAFVRVAPDQAAEVLLSVSNPEEATYPRLQTRRLVSSGVTLSQLDERQFRYQAGSAGYGYVTLLTDYFETEDGRVYGGNEIRLQFKIEVLATGVAIKGAPTDTVPFGGFGTLTAVTEPANATAKVVWTVTGGEGISIDAQGRFVAVCAGTATIRASIDGHSEEVSITVGERKRVTDITVTGVPPTTLSLGDTGSIQASVQPADAYDHTARLTVVQGRSVEIDPATGAFRAVSPGTTVIQLYADGIKKRYRLTVARDAY